MGGIKTAFVAATCFLIASCVTSKPLPKPPPTVSVTIDASRSIGTQLSYRWRIIQGTGVIANANAKTSKVTFSSKGTRLIELMVTDSGGQTDKDTTSIIVK